MRVCEVGIASASVINGLSNFTDYWKRKVLEKFVPNINLDVKMLQLKFTNDVKVMLVDAEARCLLSHGCYGLLLVLPTNLRKNFIISEMAPTIRAFSLLKVHTSAFTFKNLRHNLMLRDCENFAKVRCDLCLLLSGTLHWPRRNVCRYDLSWRLFVIFRESGPRTFISKHSPLTWGSRE